jgi:hypothetical protein
MEKLYDLSQVNDYKEYLLKKIDESTESKIFEGFLFEGNLFSMSLSAQINWSNLFFIPDNMFPITLSLKDDTGTYQLSLANRAAFYGAALYHKNFALQTCTYFKGLTTSATTLEELQDIEETLDLTL